MLLIDLELIIDDTKIKSKEILKILKISKKLYKHSEIKRIIKIWIIYA